jgi:hypothetical protein
MSEVTKRTVPIPFSKIKPQIQKNSTRKFPKQPKQRFPLKVSSNFKNPAKREGDNLFGREKRFEVRLENGCI